MSIKQWVEESLIFLQSQLNLDYYLIPPEDIISFEFFDSVTPEFRRRLPDMAFNPSRILVFSGFMDQTDPKLRIKFPKRLIFKR